MNFTLYRKKNKETTSEQCERKCENGLHHLSASMGHPSADTENTGPELVANLHDGGLNSDSFLVGSV